MGCFGEDRASLISQPVRQYKREGGEDLEKNGLICLQLCNNPKHSSASLLRTGKEKGMRLLDYITSDRLGSLTHSPARS